MVVKKRPQSCSPDNVTMDSERSLSTTTTTPLTQHSSSSHHHGVGRIKSNSSRSTTTSNSNNSSTILPLHVTKHSQSDGSDRSHSSSGSPPSSRRRRRAAAANNNNNDDDDCSNEDLLTLPTWSANPQSPGDNNNNNNNNLNDSQYNDGGGGSSSRQYFSTTQQYNNNRRTSGGNVHGHGSFYIPIPPFRCKWVVLGVAFLALMVTVLQSRGSLIYSLEEVAQLARNNNLLRMKLNDAEKGIKLLQREVSAYDVMRQQQQQQQQKATTTTSTGGKSSSSSSSSATTTGGRALPQLQQQQQRHHHLLLSQHDPRNRALEEMEQLSDRLQESQKRADRLKQRVQKLSTIEAKAKYGDHKHRVEIELSFPDGREGPTRFVIELAPLELMPHSVHFFLEMVSKGLLDGCSFILNALHVLKAAPLPYDGSSAANKARAFTRMGLESVAFKEYAPSYPHEQYTVGFAADGSPSFYINTEDNSEIHLGDPCFGKIVEGYDTVKRLEASPTRNGIWFEQRIGIKKATVLM